MMQYGIIKELNPEKNSAIVRIPMYETSQGEEALFDCVLTITPGIINGYKEGDIVIVTFENDQLDLPVIINKLYTGVTKEQESETSAFLDNLYVEGSTELSENFKVGEVTYKDLLSLKKKLNIEENNDTNVTYEHNVNIKGYFPNVAGIDYAINFTISINQNNATPIFDKNIVKNFILDEYKKIKCPEGTNPTRGITCIGLFYTNYSSTIEKLPLNAVKIEKNEYNQEYDLYAYTIDSFGNLTDVGYVIPWDDTSIKVNYDYIKIN